MKYICWLNYKKRSLESSETPVLYTGRTVPKVKGGPSQIGRNDVDLNNRTEHGDKCQAFVRSNETSVSIQGGNFLTRWGTVIFSRKTLSLVVSRFIRQVLKIRRLHTSSHPVRCTGLPAYCAQCCYLHHVYIDTVARRQVTLCPGPYCCAVTLLSVVATIVGYSGLISDRYSWH